MIKSMLIGIVLVLIVVFIGELYYFRSTIKHFQWSLYSDNQDNFTLLYPKSWTVQSAQNQPPPTAQYNDLKDLLLITKTDKSSTAKAIIYHPISKKGVYQNIGVTLKQGIKNFSTVSDNKSAQYYDKVSGSAFMVNGYAARSRLMSLKVGKSFPLEGENCDCLMKLTVIERSSDVLVIESLAPKTDSAAIDDLDLIIATIK